MIRRLSEKNYTFTDEIMANPTWQKINRIVKEFGYKFDPYARVEIYNSGKEVLEDISVTTTDEELPDIDITTKGFVLDFEINPNSDLMSMSVAEYTNYVDKLLGVCDMIDKLNSVDFSTLYRHYLDE